MQSVFNALPWIYVSLGVCVLLIGLGAWQRHGWPPLLRHCPSRPNRLTWPAVLGCALAYLLAVQLAAELLPDPRPDQQDSDARRIEITRSAVMNTAAQLTGAAAGLAVAALTFRHGLLGFGLTARRWRADLVLAVVMLMAYEPIGLALIWLAQAVMLALNYTPPDHAFIQYLHDPATPPAVLPLLWIGPVLLAPLAEETFFRGLLQTVLRRAFRSRLLAVLAAAAIFGLAHFRQPQAVLPLAAFGLFTGVLYERTGSLVGPIAFHSVFNLKNLLWQVLQAPTPPPSSLAILNCP
jgi:membrane protease YdiL (CAAX protease family)